MYNRFVLLSPLYWTKIKEQTDKDLKQDFRQLSYSPINVPSVISPGFMIYIQHIIS